MKILIIRFSSIGDIVLTSPVIRIAKRQLGAEVHYITKSKFKSLLDKNPDIAKIYTIEKNIDEVLGELKAEAYDYIIDLHNSTRSVLLKWKLHRRSYTVNKKNIAKWLMVNLKKRYVVEHIVERYLATLKPLGGKNDGLGLDFYYEAPQDLLSSFGIDREYIVVSLGANHFTKRMPVDILKKILADLAAVPVVLIGGDDVLHDALALEKALTVKVYNLAGKINISQSAALMDSSMLVITGDTGMMHIAAALKKATFVLWGSTVPEFGMYPYYGDAEVFNRNYEVKDLPCSPCSKIGFGSCPKKHFACMMRQDTGRITQDLLDYVDNIKKMTSKY